MTARSHLLLPLATMLSVLAACISESEPLEYPTIVGRFADEGERLPLIAEEAFLSDTDFFVRFRRGGDTRYGGGNWARRIPSVSQPGARCAPVFSTPYCRARRKPASCCTSTSTITFFITTTKAIFR
jgi:hypothetical protein